MKPKTDFDPMFQVNRRRRYRPILVIGPIVTAVVLSGLVLRAGPIPSRQPGPNSRKVALMPLVQRQGPGIVQNLPVRGTQPRDRFVIVAPAELDAAMVVRARADLDAAMVFNPETGRRGLVPGGPAPLRRPDGAGPGRRRRSRKYFGPQP